jgi:hypothetical protein
VNGLSQETQIPLDTSNSAWPLATTYSFKNLNKNVQELSSSTGYNGTSRYDTREFVQFNRDLFLHATNEISRSETAGYLYTYHTAFDVKKKKSYQGNTQRGDNFTATGFFVC